MTKKRRRPIHLHVMVSEEEQALIRERMAEAGIRNMGAYMRKMALNGYVLHVDLSPVQELVSLQRRCSNNLNQVAIQANTYGGIYPEEIKALQRDYEKLLRRCHPNNRPRMEALLAEARRGEGETLFEKLTALIARTDTGHDCTLSLE